MITYNLSSFFYPPLDVFYPISDKAWEERKQDTDVCWMALCPLNLAWLLFLLWFLLENPKWGISYLLFLLTQKTDYLSTLTSDMSLLLQPLGICFHLRGFLHLLVFSLNRTFSSSLPNTPPSSVPTSTLVNYASNFRVTD